MVENMCELSEYSVSQNLRFKTVATLILSVE